MPACMSPRRAKRSGTVAMVQSRRPSASIASLVTGVDTVASGLPRTASAALLAGAVPAGRAGGGARRVRGTGVRSGHLARAPQAGQLSRAYRFRVRAVAREGPLHRPQPRGSPVRTPFLVGLAARAFAALALPA